MERLRLILLAIPLLIAACSFALEDENTPVATQTAQIPTPAETVVPESTPSTPVAPPPVSQSITLTLWTSPELAPDNELPGGPLLLEQLNVFDSNHPDVALQVELKTIVDQGGSLSYLRTGRSVAPTILADVVLLPSSQLADAASQGLIYPLDGLLPEDMIADLYPVALQLAQAEERIYGYPFALTNLQHLVYNRNAITETVPTNWPELIASQPGRFVFPAAGVAGAELTLQFYQLNGGTLVNDLGQPELQVGPLTTALEQIRSGVTSNFVDVQSGSTGTYDQAWQIFQSNQEYIVQTSASHFLRQQTSESRAAYRTIPLAGPNGAFVPLVNAWVWAISTPDPARQAVAAELIAWLGSSQNMGEWSLQSAMLPARRSSFGYWPDDRYISFLQEQLEVAQPAPSEASNTIMLALSDATTAVILGLSDTATAALEAVSAIEP